MFAIKSRFNDRTMFIDIQFPLSQSVHLIVLGREVYGYALFVLYLHAGTSCLKGATILITHVLFSCEFLLRILQKILHVTAWTQSFSALVSLTALGQTSLSEGEEGLHLVLPVYNKARLDYQHSAPTSFPGSLMLRAPGAC